MRSEFLGGSRFPDKVNHPVPRGYRPLKAFWPTPVPQCVRERPNFSRVAPAQPVVTQEQYFQVGQREPVSREEFRQSTCCLSQCFRVGQGANFWRNAARKDIYREAESCQIRQPAQFWRIPLVESSYPESGSLTGPDLPSSGGNSPRKPRGHQRDISADRGIIISEYSRPLAQGGVGQANFRWLRRMASSHHRWTSYRATRASGRFRRNPPTQQPAEPTRLETVLAFGLVLHRQGFGGTVKRLPRRTLLLSFHYHEARMSKGDDDKRQRCQDQEGETGWGSMP